MSIYPQRQGILSQGDKLAVLSNFGPSGLILDGYEVSGVSIETRIQELYNYGYGFGCTSLPVGLSATIEIRSMGRVTMVDKEVIQRAFASPEEMSIEDLLRIVYRKMNQRSGDDV